MKIETFKDKLNWAASKTERAVGKNLNLPVLSCLYLEAKKDKLVVRATNLDLGIEVEVPVKVSKEGVVAVPAQTFISLLNNIKDDDRVELELVDDKLTISTEDSVSNIKTFPHEDFPTIPRTKKDTKNSVSIPVEDFVGGLKSVWGSAAVSSIKPELSSVYVYEDDGQLVFVATDSFRLAEKKIPFKNGGFEEGVLIPIKNATETAKALDSISDDLSIIFSDGQIGFEVGGLYITSRVVDGVFPNYKQIIPKDFSTKATVLKEDILGALRLANIFSDKFNKIEVEVDSSKNKINISTKNNDLGDSKKTINSKIEGEGLVINFNHKYIIDGFSVLDSQSTALHLSGSQKPMVVRSKDDASFTYLVMPMNK